MTLINSFKVLATALVTAILFVGNAPAATITFSISDLTFAGASGQNGWPFPVSVSEPGVDGHFLWTYTPNDFQHGSATLLDLTLPITAYPLSNAIITADITGISGTNPGNFQNLTYDWAIVFAPPLVGPTQSTSINPSRSTFDFTGTYLFINGEWSGKITGGTVAPAEVPPSSTPEPRTAGCVFVFGAAVILLHRKTPKSATFKNKSVSLISE